MHLPLDAKERKSIPLYEGLFKYFPDALIWVAKLSKVGNDQHNPGQPLHWAREKSTDHGDCILRHQMDVGSVDTDGIPHSVKVAWRALAQAQVEIEQMQQFEAVKENLRLMVESVQNRSEDPNRNDYC